MSGLPFLPYGRQLIEEDDVQAVVDVLRSDYLTTGPAVEQFERELALAVGAPAVVAVSNGTAALHAACFAAGLEDGDEVLVPAITFLATANCARYLGAEPVFVDVDPDTGLMDPTRVPERLSERTKAMIPVHLNGALADLRALRAVAGNVIIIEDAAHALGADAGGRPVGACHGPSQMAIFSFHPVKHITTGEGGAVAARDPVLLDRLRLFRNHGIARDPGMLRSPSPGPWYYEQQVLGYNMRLSDLHAALGVSQLGKLPRFIERRRELAARYSARFAQLSGVKPVTGPTQHEHSAYHLYAVLIEFNGVRAEVMTRLHARGVGTQVHYIPLPMQPYYRARGWDPAEFPGALRYYEQTLSLPLFPAMADADVDRVVDAVEEVMRELGLA